MIVEIKLETSVSIYISTLINHLIYSNTHENHQHVIFCIFSFPVKILCHVPVFPVWSVYISTYFFVKRKHSVIYPKSTTKLTYMSRKIHIHTVCTFVHSIIFTIHRKSSVKYKPMHILYVLIT